MMKLKNIIKNTIVGALLIGGSYAFINPVDAKAATNIELSEKAKSELNENAKVESTIKKVEEEHPMVEGATVKKYTYVSGSDYVKNKNYYKVYKLYWTSTSTSKVSYVGIAMHVASSYEQVMYSTSGNKVDSRAKLTSKQKKIITTLKNNKTYSKQFRYVAIYDTNAKWTRLYIIPKNNKKAIDEIESNNYYYFDSKENLSIALPSAKSSLKAKVKIAYNLHVLPHVAAEKEWYNALGGEVRYKKSFHGYAIGYSNTDAMKLPKSLQ